MKRQQEHAATVSALRDQLVARVRAAVPDALLNGDPIDRLPGNAHFSFPGCAGDALLLLLDAAGIACSTGSACSAGVAQPSHVLLAMGADDDRAPSRRCGSRSATRRPRPTSTSCSRCCRARSSGRAGRTGRRRHAESEPGRRARSEHRTDRRRREDRHGHGARQPTRASGYAWRHACTGGHDRRSRLRRRRRPRGRRPAMT